MSDVVVDPQGDFRDLYCTTYGDVLRFVQRRCPPETAEDVTAEVFLTAWRRYGDLPAAHEQRRAWLFGTARNVLLNTRRGEDRRAALTVRIAAAGMNEGLPESPDPTARLDLESAWRHLSPDHQEVLALHLWDDLPSAQAGAVLGISATAYRIRLSRARRALRALYATSDTVAADRTASLHPEGEPR